MTPASLQLGRGRAVRQTVWITVAAAGVYFGVRSMPMDRSDLHYTDFGTGQGGPLEFCAPGGAQFVPVDRVPSPVSLTVRTSEDRAIRAGEPARLVLRLITASGKPVADADLLVVHTRKLHLLAVDPTLQDYQHLHPEPLSQPGEYAVAFTPARGGEYRFFADFTPRPTGRALYAGARVRVAEDARMETAQAAAADETFVSVVEGYRFELALDPRQLRTNETAAISLTVASPDGTPAALEEIMGAHAHVVAFDLGCTGFAHLHPLAEPDPATRPDAPLRFELNLPDPGTYRLWAQVKIGGRERFAPFSVKVRP